jgi:hypothetical protein
MGKFLALARMVRTAEGSKRFGAGIGQQIQRKQEQPKAKMGVSATHMRSLYRQIQAAKKSGDKAQVAKLEETFRSQFVKFAEGKSLAEAIAWASPGKQQDS